MLTIPSNEDYYFAGLFMGEGCVVVGRRRNRHKPDLWSYRPELVMRMRSDDRSVLEWIKSRYGGTVCDVYVSPTSGNPMSQWGITGYKDVPPILDTILATGMPGKKMREVKLLRDFCDFRHTLPYQLTDPDLLAQLDQFFIQLKEMRVFKVHG
jgi:hypothetical protein